MEISVSIGGGQNMTLSGAVLVYQGGREAFAVWHPAKPGGRTMEHRTSGRQNR